MGAPGAGKGTQGIRLCKHYSYEHLSTGDLFRSHLDKKTDFGLRIREFLDAGNLVPDDVVNDLVVTTLQEHQARRVRGVLLDGYPRTLEQARPFHDKVVQKGEVSALKVLHLAVPRTELQRRLELRGVTSGRSDDMDSQKIIHRLDVYEKETQPVLAYYRSLGCLSSVKGMGDEGAIFEALCWELDTFCA